MLKNSILLVIIFLNFGYTFNSFAGCPSVINVATEKPSCNSIYFAISVDLNNSPTHNLTINFGDGTPLLYVNNLTSSNYNTTHVYPTSGSYTYTVQTSYSDCGGSVFSNTLSINCNTTSCLTYSVLSTGFDRQNNIPFINNAGNFDPYWFVVEREDVGPAPQYLPISGTKVSLFNLAYNINPLVFGNLYYPGNAKYINYASTYSSSYQTTNITTYRTYFKLPNPLPVNKTYSLSLKMRADDGIYRVKVNGRDIKTIGYGNTGSAYTGESLDLQIDSCDYFKVDSNYIDIVVGDLGLAATQLAAEIILTQCNSEKCTVNKRCCINNSLSIINPKPTYCVGQPVTFKYNGVTCDNQSINMGDGCGSYPFSSNGTKTIVYTYLQPGTYNVIVGGNSGLCTSTSIVIKDCIDDSTGTPPLAVCQGSFKPTPGDYVLSFWVKEDLASLANTITFSSGIDVILKGMPGLPITIPVYANAPSNSKSIIIDGWQKVEAVITIPFNATGMDINLKNNTNVDVYFDDIRFHPFNSSFKSFVYYTITIRLAAELDERNYATFYEYDEEGQLIRVKKETEKGIKTIKESRTSVAK